MLSLGPPANVHSQASASSSHATVEKSSLVLEVKRVAACQAIAVRQHSVWVWYDKDTDRSKRLWLHLREIEAEKLWYSGSNSEARLHVMYKPSSSKTSSASVMRRGSNSLAPVKASISGPFHSGYASGGVIGMTRR